MELTRRGFLGAAAAAGLAGAAPPRCAMGLVVHSFGVNRPKDSLELLEVSNRMGAGGIQARLGMKTPDGIPTLRAKADEYGMFLEGMASLPKTDDTSKFEQTVKDSKEAGAKVIRTACLGGRRYETFKTLPEWREFVAGAKASLRRAVPIVEKHKVTLAFENHKDWTTEEQLALLKEYESEHVAVTLDTGNNLALLDHPMEHVEALAKYAAATHLKDMGVAEYEEGFLLAEVPFGEGVLDMVKVAAMIRKARPQTNMALEMITRDPLKVPCLTESYWEVFPGREGRHLAKMLSLVKANKPRNPLPYPSKMDDAGKRRAELDNIKACLNFARERMDL